MLLLPSTTRPSVTSRRQAAWRESMREAGAAVEVGESEVWGMRGNLPDSGKGLARCCQSLPAVDAAALTIWF